MVNAMRLMTALRKLAKTGSCTDSVIRGRILVGIIDNFTRKKFLQATDLTSISLEFSARRSKVINYIRYVKKGRKSPGGRNKTSPPDYQGETHARTVISRINHFIACCRESKKNFLSMECESEDQEYLAVIAVEEHFNSVTSAGNRNQVFATLTVNGKE
ncbi:hypothetical protein P5673_030158 [Acropora cervicornis]|uniref:Uncharacterized protein n=1 Tax=Acropora cervicornis TaxID=6130 RepID=A0AAD9UTS0_ACRCE|nr:hypothetical protein P5673_030158 [Acropora cervicornis]